MEFNTRQKKVIHATEPKILCLAAASSGKTKTLTERIRILVEEQNILPQDIVAVTFTNLAADEMRRRLGDLSKGMFIGTIHSYANDICRLNQIDTSIYIQQEDFDNILIEAIKLPKYKYKKIKHLLVDECQDLCPLEYQFLSRIPTENQFWVGDDRQCIYQFKNSSDEFLKGMWLDTNYTKYYLTQNYRNAPNILKFAEKFLSSIKSLSPQSTTVKKKKGIVEETNFNDALDILEENENWGSWFILTRTNSELMEVQRRLDKRDIPNITFKKADLDSSMLMERMKSNKVKVLTIHSMKGLEAPKVIVVGAKLYNEEERKIAYVAATRAESELYWCPTITNRSQKKNAKKYFLGGVTEF